MFEHLRYRRQFLLTKTEINAPIDWNHTPLHPFHLYAHPDLSVTVHKDHRHTLALLGSIFDPNQPNQDNHQVLTGISRSISAPRNLFPELKRYVGHYALLYKNRNDTIILNDALGLREVYYSCAEANRVVCASQPHLLAQFAEPQVRPRCDAEFLTFYKTNSVRGRWNPYRRWIGDETYYEDVKHLMPNHYLDINTTHVSRYWPTAPIEPSKPEKAVERACAFLQNSLRAMAHRHPLMMAVTAGTDSRTLLAASRGIKDDIYYFVNDQGLGSDHPDIWVPKQIFESLGVPFHVHTVPPTYDEAFAKVFLENTFFASERILPTIFNVYFCSLQHRVNILGVGEIGRVHYGKPPKRASAYLLAYILRHRDGGRYALRQAEQILNDLLPIANRYSLNVLTLLLWEQLLGNWGATGNSESDIAVEELNPFDSHELYETLLSVDEEYSRWDRARLFKAMIGRMWPELLHWPINPPRDVRGNVAQFLRTLGMYDTVKGLKYCWYRLGYSLRCGQGKMDVV